MIARLAALIQRNETRQGVERKREDGFDSLILWQNEEIEFLKAQETILSCLAYPADLILGIGRCL